MKKNKLPKGWDEERVKKVLVHYEKQNGAQAVAEDEATSRDPAQTVIEVPHALLPIIRELIHRHESSQARGQSRKRSTHKT